MIAEGGPVSSAEYLEGQMRESVAAIRKKKKKRSQAYAWTLHISSLVVAGLSTVLLGLQIDNPSYVIWSRNLALVFTAIGTLAAGLLTFWNLDEYWLKQRVMLARLETLLKEFQYYLHVQDVPSRSKVDLFHRRYMTILAQQVEYWETTLVKGDDAVREPNGGA